MTKPLWAPWRLEYIHEADGQPGCIFCPGAAALDEDVRVSGRRVAVVLGRLTSTPASPRRGGLFRRGLQGRSIARIG